MLAFALILFAVSIPFGGIGIALLRGKSDLVMDKAAYAKAFCTPMFIIAGSMVLAGLLALAGLAVWSMGALLGGLTIAIVWILRIQMRYNNGLF